MDFTLSLSSDWFNLMALPLIFITIKEVVPKWRSLWDDNLTNEDRRLLLRMVIFLVLPVVVFLHETGHLLAALQVHAKVYDFHYGPLTGFVRVDANLPPEYLLWIAIAGNLVQIILGMIALVAATIVRAPAMVAFLVYLGLFAIGDTVVFYAALSLASYYGDWKNIYQSPCSNLVLYVGLVHGALISFIIYCMSASAPRRWFTQKTNPLWSKKHAALEAEVRQEPGLVNCIELANSFAEAGLYKEASSWFNKAESFSPENPGIDYARAEMEMSRGNVDKALSIYERLCNDERLDSAMQAQIILQLGEIWLFRRDTPKALACFEKASLLDENQGDARLQKALLKVSMQDYDGLEEDIARLRSPDTLWIYKRSHESAPAEIAKLESLLERKSK